MNQNTLLPVAVLGDSGLAVIPGWLTLYTIDAASREYQQVIDEYLPEGVGLPALSYLDKPPAAESGMAVVRNLARNAWEMVADHRGQMAYNTENGQGEKVTKLGPLVAGLTLQAPASIYDMWDGNRWWTDNAKQQAANIEQVKNELQQRQRLANETISLLVDAVELGMATAEESSALVQWKTYRVLLSRVDATMAPDIEWPIQPEQ